MNKRILLPFLLLLIYGSVHAQSAPAKSEGVKAIVVIDNPEALKQAGIEMPEEAEGPEHTPGSPVLETDDTGTPGPHGVEINFFGDCDRVSGARTCDAVIDANYGIGEKLELTVQRPYSVSSEQGEPTRKGMGPTEVGFKFRFLDRNGLSAAIAPSYTVDNAKRYTDEDGNLEEGEGNSVYIPLILQKDMKNVSVVTNLGYRKMLKDRDDDAVVASVAVGHALSERSRLVGEAITERDAHTLKKRETDIRVGYMRVIFPKWKKYEVNGFVSIGRSIGHTEDGKVHKTVRFGLNVAGK
jgi:hypothetical protein